jgi:zinc transporter, ZIP family
MPQSFLNMNPILQALLATLFTRGLAALGAAVVFIARNIGQKKLESMLGFSVMMILDVAFG